MNKQERAEHLRLEVETCRKCGLCTRAKNKVLGEGNLDALIFLVGEAPGRDEDEQGRPFVGSAGKLLNKLLSQAKLLRNDVYIGNVVKRRPQGNRRPIREELEACAPYIEEQLEIIQPKIVAPMGNSALGSVFMRYGLPEAVIGEVHGKSFDISTSWGKAKVFPLYHPAAAIYNRKLLNNLEEDMKRLGETALLEK
ncbi:MAG: uracil-DNA glycosylase [Candidatus Bathyarchaeota archaeon]|nr:uracil-DNA glycosylase [Candidatus Bathyarchaeota archaeon]